MEQIVYDAYDDGIIVIYDISFNYKLDVLFLIYENENTGYGLMPQSYYSEYCTHLDSMGREE